MIEIVLPLPHKHLSPNSRCHYMAKAKAAKKARTDAKYAALAAANERGWDAMPQWESATVETVFYHRDRRRRDRDNALSSCKNFFDGLTDAKLISDDSGLTHLPVRIEIDKANPRVVLRVSETK